MLERKVEGVAVMTFGIEQPLLEQTRGTQHPPGVRRFGAGTANHQSAKGRLPPTGFGKGYSTSRPWAPKYLVHSPTQAPALGAIAPGCLTKSLGECGIPLEPEW